MSKVLVTQSKIEDIADRLRAKTNVSGDISLEQIKIDVAGTPSQITEPIPDYIVAEARRVANVVKGRQAGRSNYVSFITVSDIHHLITNDAQYASAVTTSATVLKHCAMGAYLVSRYADIDFGIMLGDYINGGQIDPEEFAKKEYLDVLNYFSSFVDIGTQGNHDCGMGKWSTFLSNTDLYNRIGRFARNAVRPATDADRGYYYYDVPGKKFRVIVLNTNDIKGMAIKPYNESNTPKYFDGHRVSMTQLKWFRDVLFAIPSDYSFIVCSHEPIHWEDWEYTDANNVTWACSQAWRDILEAYINKSQKTVSYTIGHTNPITKTVIDGETLTVDFRNTNTATFVATFHGHTHNFITGTYGTANIVRIGTPNSCNNRTNAYARTNYPETTRQKYGELDQNGNRVTAYEKTAPGTTNETAFVVNTIDLDTGSIHSDYYGAGHYRFIRYSTGSQYSIINTLSYVTNSNTDVLIDPQTSYSGTLTAVSGYEIKSENVSITMGGVNITSNAYNEATGAIYIESVTGDIEITATGTVLPTYTNLVATSTDSSGNLFNGTGYKNGYRLNSSGNESDNGPSTISGFIEYSVGDIIRTKGDVQGNPQAYIYISIYNANKTHIKSFQMYQLTNNSKITYLDGTYGWSVNTSDTGSTTANSYFTQGKYIRFCLNTAKSGRTADVTNLNQFILTLNEVIE